MQFVEGKIVVHPHHGPARIHAIRERKVRGELVSYIDLFIQETGMKIAVPMSTADEVGLRDVMTPDETEALLAVLRAEGEPQEEQWSRRMKANGERLKTGELDQLAVVVRDLTRRDREKPLSHGERTMLRDARDPLISELSVALSKSPEDAEAMLDEVITGEPAPERDELLIA